MSNSYEEFVVEYMGGSIKDYAMDKILEAVQDYLVDKGFGRDLVESSILYVTNGGQGVDFSKYLDVDKNSKFAQTLATIDIAKCYSCLATITDFSNHIQNLYHGLEELDSSDLDSYERDINLKATPHKTLAK